MQLTITGIVFSDGYTTCDLTLRDNTGEPINYGTIQTGNFRDIRETLYRPGVYYLVVECHYAEDRYRDRPPSSGPLLEWQAPAVPSRTAPRGRSARLANRSTADVGSRSHSLTTLALSLKARGVSIPRPRWGRTSLYSITHSAITT